MAYNVFISSTFADFKKERKLISELMGLIPAAPINAENLGGIGKDLNSTLRSYIDMSDIIVLLIGSRAGSWAPTGETWTQMEVKYAFSKNKKVFAYIRHPPKGTKKLIDEDERKQKSIKNFVDYVDERVALVPRVEYKECCKLAAMIVRDVERYSKELRDKENREMYEDSFD